MMDRDAVQPSPHIQELISRRMVLGGMAALPILSLTTQAGAESGPLRAPSFTSVAATTADAVTVPEGYVAKTLIAWGDPLFDSVGPFNPDALTRAEQEQRFGQNNDMMAIFPAEWTNPKATNQDRFLFCSNHEYMDPSLMFPALTSPKELTTAHMQAAWASMGVSVYTVERSGSQWRVVRDEKPGAGRNRRITPFTPVVFSGPAAQHPWIVAAGAKVNAVETGGPAGTIACGTHSNCAGGETPWGTYLTSEENFNTWFSNSSKGADGFSADPALQIDAENFGYPLMRGASRPGFPEYVDLAKNPTGAALYGWVVEIDPYDPTWAPRKRTALGRKKGECATSALTRDGRVAIYMGDDQIDEFVYKYVSKKRFDPKNRTANRGLLDEGQLYVARLFEDGTGEWVPITLARANAAAKALGYAHPFKDEGDLMVRSREAARLLGATPMDRPEDVEALHDARWVGQGGVLVVCTKNPQQGFEHPGNPRRRDPDFPTRAQPNLAGHILRLDEARNDCGATTFKWGVFALGGDPNAAGLVAKTPTGTRLHTDVVFAGQATISGDRFACPDNICIDGAQNVWVATDGSDAVFGDCNDQVVVMPVTANGPRPVRRFLVGPVGAEICGPTMAPDDRAFFASIQHPGESDRSGKSFSEARWAGAKPFSSFPDGGWPRSAVVVVTKADGGIVGT